MIKSLLQITYYQDSMANLSVSVVITAYNRTSYIAEAINSVMNQTLDASRFEIIIISNFEVLLDDKCSSYRIKQIVMNGTIGEYLYQGISAASHEIVAFLDDDDIWHKDRLIEILEVFSSFSSVIYYHNSQWFLDSNGNSIVPIFKNPGRFNKATYKVDASDSKDISKLLNLAVGFNLSSIAILKMAFVNSLEKLMLITANTDGFFFWNALILKGEIYVDNRKLSGYRIHFQNVSLSNETQSNENEILRQMKTIEIIETFVNGNTKDAKNKVIRQYLSLQYLEWEAQHIMQSRKNKVELLYCLKQMIKLITFPIDLSTFRILLYTMAYVVHPKAFSFVRSKVSINSYFYN